MKPHYGVQPCFVPPNVCYMRRCGQITLHNEALATACIGHKMRPSRQGTTYPLLPDAMDLSPRIWDDARWTLRSLRRKHRKANIFSLPDELLEMIKNFISYQDYHTHMSLRMTCKRMWNFYSGNEETWEYACYEMLIGLPRGDTRKSRMWLVFAYTSHCMNCKKWWCRSQSTFSNKQHPTTWLMVLAIRRYVART